MQAIARRCTEVGVIAIVADVDKQELHALAGQLAAGYQPSGWRPVASSPHARVAFNSERQLIYREFRSRSPVDSLMARLQGGRAERARRNSDALLLAGIDAPASVHAGRLPGGTEYLFSARLPGRRLHRWMQDFAVTPDDTTRNTRRALLAALGVFVGRLHAAGFIHGDLRPENILADQRGDFFQFALLDNEYNQRKSPPPGRLLLRNLMQLNTLPANLLSHTDRMRFFRSWRSHLRDYSTPEVKLLAAEVCRRAMPGAPQSAAPQPAAQTSAGSPADSRAQPQAADGSEGGSTP